MRTRRLLAALLAHLIDTPAASPALPLRNGQFVGTTEHGVARFHGDYSPDPPMATNCAESIAWYGDPGEVPEQRGVLRLWNRRADSTTGT